MENQNSNSENNKDRMGTFNDEVNEHKVAYIRAKGLTGLTEQESDCFESAFAFGIMQGAAMQSGAQVALTQSTGGDVNIQNALCDMATELMLVKVECASTSFALACELLDAGEYEK